MDDTIKLGVPPWNRIMAALWFVPPRTRLATAFLPISATRLGRDSLHRPERSP